MRKYLFQGIAGQDKKLDGCLIMINLKTNIKYASKTGREPTVNSDDFYY